MSDVLAKICADKREHIAARKRAVPMWLFRQYNPQLGDGSRIRAGDVVVFPVVEKVTN